MPISTGSKLFESNAHHFLPPLVGSGVRLQKSPTVAEKYTLTETSMLLLDSMGVVVSSDQSAKHYCELGDGLSMDAGSLRMRTFDGRFHGPQLYRFALASKRTVHFVPRSGKLPLEVRFLPLPAGHQTEGFMVCLLRDEEQERSTQLRLLCLHYRLRSV